MGTALCATERGLSCACPLRICYCSCACQKQLSFPGQRQGNQRGDTCNGVSVAPSAVGQFPWSWSCLQAQEDSAPQQSLRQLFHRLFALLKGFTVALPQVQSGPHVAGTAFPALGGIENRYPLFCFVFTRIILHSSGQTAMWREENFLPLLEPASAAESPEFYIVFVREPPHTVTGSQVYTTATYNVGSSQVSFLVLILHYHCEFKLTVA